MFKIEETSVKPVTVFSQQIDEDGDLLLLANDIKWGCIESSSGKLIRFFVDEAAQEKVPELSFDQDGQLVVAT